MNITVYCGAQTGKDPEFRKRAAELGTWMAENGHALVYGAGDVGMMGVISNAVMEAGGLVSDDIVIGILKDRIAQDDAKNGFILDGFPRTVPQANAFIEALKDMNDAMDFALDVDVPDEAIVQRMSGRRDASAGPRM